jgi:hypothetical protein
MKTAHTSIKAAMIMVLAFATHVIQAQETPPKVEIRKAGFGMKFSLLGMDDLGITTNLSGGKAFFASVNPIKNFRIEPEFGYASSTYRSPNSGNELSSKGSHYGASIYYMFQKGNANFYFGPTLQVQKISTDQEQFVSTNYSGYPIYKATNVESKGTSLGLIAGAEYFMSRHFSFGMELGYWSYKYNPDLTKTDESKSGYTTGNLVLRAYF